MYVTSFPPLLKIKLDPPQHLRVHKLTKNSAPLPAAPAKRLMSLQAPTRKMSKSDPAARSRIHLTDPTDVIQRTLRAAVTDSVPGPLTYDREARPGVANLFDLLFYASSTLR